MTVGVAVGSGEGVEVGGEVAVDVAVALSPSEHAARAKRVNRMAMALLRIMLARNIRRHG
jgi:hypothetical protein